MQSFQLNQHSLEANLMMIFTLSALDVVHTACPIKIDPIKLYIWMGHAVKLGLDFDGTGCTYLFEIEFLVTDFLFNVVQEPPKLGSYVVRHYTRGDWELKYSIKVSLSSKFPRKYQKVA